MQALKRTAAAEGVILFGCVLLAWCVELVDRIAFGGSLERFGIRPRDVSGLWGILVAPLLYGGVLWGVLPGQAGISWEGHLFGFVAGIVAARLFVTSTGARRRPAPA